MGPEANIHSIKALEKQIEEGSGDIIKLKRARNSLLNISTRVPPEILGCILVWTLVRETGRLLYSASPHHTSTGYKRVPTTSFSFATTGSMSLLAHQSFGVSGEAHWRFGRNGITVPAPPPSTWCWTETSATLMPLMDPSRTRSEVASCKTPYDRFI